MNILIAGASGFIGAELAKHLSNNHKITALGRNVEKLASIFSKDINLLSWSSLSIEDASKYQLIINLSGANIGDKRWTPTQKKELITSRTATNQHLIEWLTNQHAKPRFFCANAVGIYGAQGLSSTTFDEDASLPASSHDFLQHIGLIWQQSLNAAIDAGLPVTTLRFGVVLKQGEGMLKKLELPFRLGLGSILGNGYQSLSWIYYKDLIRAIDFLIEHPEVTGPVNITSPNPISQRDFSQKLAKTLNRPFFLSTPGFFIKALFGEMGEYLLLKGQKVVPKRLIELGFKFNHPNIESVLIEEFHKDEATQ